jgi:hypothetical protein
LPIREIRPVVDQVLDRLVGRAPRHLEIADVTRCAS